MKAVVIGAGFGGLSAAALLAKEGFEVEVIEQNDQPGGRAGRFEEEGFNFDMGPSWYLAPDVFENFFAEFGKEVRDYYTLNRLDPSYKAFFEDSELTLSASLEENVKLFESIEPGAGEALRRYVADAKRKYEAAMDRYLYKDYRSVFQFFTAETLAMHRDLFMSVQRHARRYFKDERLRRIVTYPVVFLGGSEKKTPAFYSLLTWADLGLGVWYPDGGFYSVARGFERLAKEQGAKFSYGDRVERIESDRIRARRVITDKRSIAADVVLVNADYATAELTFLEPADRTIKQRAWDRKTFAPSCMCIYLGLDRRIPGLEHHSLFFDGDWDAHFHKVFDEPGWPEHPSYYVCASSKTDLKAAPKDMENLFFLVPLAPGLHDSDEERTELRNHVIDRFEQRMGVRIEDHIVVEKLFSHRDFIERYGAYKGTAFGLAHTLFQSAAFRPPHRSDRLSNLYYSGHYTHPGVGVPMTIISSQIAARLIKQDAD